MSASAANSEEVRPKGPPKGGGSRKGKPNKATADVRAAVALLAQRNIEKLEGWLNRAARKQPAKAADLLIRVLEYHIPKLARTEVTGMDGGPLQAVAIVTNDPIEASKAYQEMVKS